MKNVCSKNSVCVYYILTQEGPPLNNSHWFEHLISSFHVENTNKREHFDKINIAAASNNISLSNK